MLKEQDKKIASLIWQEIEKAKNILLHLHPRPDGDSVGSTLAMYHALTALGKNVTLIKGDSSLPAFLSHLPGFDKITPKNFFEIDLATFDLFIIHDSSVTGHISTLGEIKFPENLKTVVIDHHASNVGYGDICLLDPEYSSVCEMVFDLLNEWKIVINKEIATCLIVGIFTDTGGFRYSSTTSDTFTVASELTKIAPEWNKEVEIMENNNTKGQIAFEGLALSSIKTYLNDHVAVSAVSLDKLKEHNIAKEDANSYLVKNRLKSVVGWDIGVFMVEEMPGIVKASLRTRDEEKYDVSKVAAALGGGGHKGASGLVIKLPLEEAVKKLIDTISSLYTF